MIIQKIQNTNIIIQNKTEKNSKSHDSCLPHNPPAPLYLSVHFPKETYHNKYPSLFHWVALCLSPLSKISLPKQTDH